MDLVAPVSSVPPIPAAEYLRMSTDAQHYSIPHQQSVNRQYAAAHGMQIIRTYADEGRSGLTLHRRDALVQLLRDVQSGSADFKTILVYDVSRWGRFQDVDESAHYEYLCRAHNIRVHYCAEPFANQTGPLVDILKAIKRAMAAEYSRELATKIAFAQRRGAMQGHFQGGPPGYGFRRMLVARDGKHIQILERGAHKGIKDYRTVLVPGPSHEVDTVRRIFHLYVDQRLDSLRIARTLNAEGNRFHGDRDWSRWLVQTVLRNERYAGSLVYNRSSSNLIAGAGTGRTRNHPAQWVRAPIGFGFVTEEVFERARVFRGLHGKSYRDNAVLLERLRDLWAKHGKLNTTIINNTRGMPTTPVYWRHFGSLRRAYELIGYVQAKDWGGQPQSLSRQAVAKRIIGEVIAEAQRRGAATRWDGMTRQLVIDGQRTVAAVVARNTKRYSWSQWRVVAARGYLPDLTIVARMDVENREPQDYLLVPPAIAATLLNKTFRDTPMLEAKLVTTIAEVARAVLDAVGR